MGALKRAVFALSFFVASAAMAQMRESVTVEVIEVPVYVTLGDGTPVRSISFSTATSRDCRKPPTIW